ncbi:hypothetical protein NQ317_003572 [Molorchus minor]|uniref:Uncharacterized protein n=1 Tax=Molorchus minor TaxID=1323400 RepID=A0ABQ9JDI3_9CUCU|nr:hypothetical protein NQ317_003572 [Molorchus minor]
MPTSQREKNVLELAHVKQGSITSYSVDSCCFNHIKDLQQKLKEMVVQCHNPKLDKPVRTKNNEVHRNFRPSMYDLSEWICGCDSILADINNIVDEKPEWGK